MQLVPRRVLLRLFFVIEIGDVGYRSLAHRLVSWVMLECVFGIGYLPILPYFCMRKQLSMSPHQVAQMVEW